MVRRKLATEITGINDAVGELLAVINGYNYVGGNPVNRVDPSGMCWVNNNASPEQQSQCYDAWLAYTNIVTNTYTQNWPRDVQVAMTQEAHYWGNLSYSDFTSRWNSGGSLASNNTLSNTSQTLITSGGVLVIADGPLPIGDIPGGIIIVAGLCLAGLAVLSTRNNALPRHQVYDFGIVQAVAVPVDYDALDRDYSIPKKFPNQQCSEKLRLQLQDEINNQWCNQSRSCTDLSLSCTDIASRIMWNDLCLASREMMKSRCFPTDPSHDSQIETVRGIRDRCYQEFFNRCGS